MWEQVSPDGEGEAAHAVATSYAPVDPLDSQRLNDQSFPYSVSSPIRITWGVQSAERIEKRLNVGRKRCRLGFKRLKLVTVWGSFSGLKPSKTRFLQCRIIRRIIRNGEKPEKGQSGRILGDWTRNLGVC